MSENQPGKLGTWTERVLGLVGGVGLFLLAGFVLVGLASLLLGMNAQLLDSGRVEILSMSAAAVGLLAGLSLWIRDLLHRRRTETPGRGEESPSPPTGIQEGLAAKALDKLPLRVALLDATATVLDTNKAMRDGCHGRTPEGKPCTLFPHDCKPSNPDCLVKEAARKGEVQIGKGLRHDPETGQLFSLEAHPLEDADGNVRLVMEIARDVTESQNLLTELQSQSRLAAVGQVAAGVAHDLRTPLNAMQVAVDLLEADLDANERKEALEILQRQVSSLTTQARSITDFARRQAKDTAEGSMKTAVDRAISLARFDPRALDVDITVNVAGDVPPVNCPEDILVPSVSNLLTNAFDAMPHGGEIRISAEETAVGTVRLHVRDTGHGMPPEVQKRVFDPLFTTKGESGGTGLGLARTKSSIEEYGGSMDVESTPGEGSTFTIELKAADAESN